MIEFSIGQDQRPEPFEHILEWLRGHALVRLIEGEYEPRTPERWGN